MKVDSAAETREHRHREQQRELDRQARAQGAERAASAQ